MATEDALVTQRLREAGAVFVGKTNLHEFAFGTTSEDSGFGPARNPHDPARSPGGSSGGSAAAVASGMSLGTVGTDTGGSIRIPAAACGVVGLKGEWGHISASGVVPLSRQLDHVGPLAASVADAWLLYNAMQPHSGQIRDALDAMPVKGMRLGKLSGYFFDRLDADVERSVLETIDRLQKRGAKVVDVSVPHAGDMAAIYLHLVFGDAAEYHARTLVTRPQDYTPAVRLRLEMAGYVLAEDYIRALRGKDLIAREVDRALDGVDALVLPALAIPAPPRRVTMPARAVPTGAHAVCAARSRSACRDIPRFQFRPPFAACQSDYSSSTQRPDAGAWQAARAARRRRSRRDSRLFPSLGAEARGGQQ
jgi:aspartyl-tRNA(Asn)/glutamyl-tRNA(Gln) amidotransferase subunit A